MTQSSQNDKSWIPATLLQEGTKWRRKFIWDADDAAFTFHENLARYIRKQRQIDLNVDTCAFYDFSLDPNLSYSNAQFQEDLLAFARLSSGGYDTRTVRPGVKKAMKLLADHNIANCLWTAAPGTNDHIPWAGRKYWTASPQEATFKLIAENKLPIKASNVKFISAHEKAGEMEDGHHPAIADDYPVTVVDVSTRGLLGFLIDQPYNQGIVAPNLIRAKKAMEMARMIIELFDELAKRDLIAER